MLLADRPIIQKRKMFRSRKLLDLANGAPCMFMGTAIGDLFPGHHPNDTVVACHSNQQEHGKAKARKAHDCFIAFGCDHCHRELDQGRRLTREEKVKAFELAMRNTRAWLFAADKIETEEENETALIYSDQQWLEAWQAGKAWVK